MSRDTYKGNYETAKRTRQRFLLTLVPFSKTAARGSFCSKRQEFVKYVQVLATRWSEVTTNPYPKDIPEQPILLSHPASQLTPYTSPLSISRCTSLIWKLRVSLKKEVYARAPLLPSPPCRTTRLYVASSFIKVVQRDGREMGSVTS